MRVLLLFRGAPGSGKSTYIEKHGLKQYALSADDIRLQTQSPVLNNDGHMVIKVNKEKTVWEHLFRMLEDRMKNGDFTVIDATNSKTVEINRYKELADRYRYRIYLIDLTDVPIEVCKERNAKRDEYKRVPEEAIDMMYARFETQTIPKSVKVLKPNQLDEILYKPFDASQYEAIHYFGDIHGCITVLRKGLKKIYSQYHNEPASDTVKDEDLLLDNHLYVFLGDYLDRGLENVEVLQFLSKIYKNKNVILLEGNHDQNIRNWASGIDDYPKYFRKTTQLELDRAFTNGLVNKNEVRQLCRRFNQLSYATYNNKKILACHGGLSGMGDNLVYVPTSQIIRGVGKYEEYLDIAKAFENNTDENTIQISGHRNILNHNIQATERCFNLEGQVEFGGHLRIVTLDKNGIHCHEIKNDVYKTPSNNDEERAVTDGIKIHDELSISTLIDILRNNKYINEREQGDISSFNFTKDAFDKKIWNDQTCKARGLFIDTKNNRIQARGYLKFFNINERAETEVTHLKYKLQFPVNVYLKENGFLGMISYNKEEDRLMLSTKSIIDSSSNEGDVVQIFKDMFEKMTTDVQKNNMYEYLKTNNKTILIECVNNELDPHIIDYDKPYLFLLDIVSNDLECNKVNYHELTELAEQFGLTCKEKVVTFDEWSDFYKWYLEVTKEGYQYNGKNIEGFVIEDDIGYMVKLKVHYYNYWKFLRGVTKTVLKQGTMSRKGALCNAESNYFYGYITKNRDKYTYIDDKEKTRIKKDFNFLKLRKDFYEYMNQKVGDC